MKRRGDGRAITQHRLALCEQALAAIEQSDAIYTEVGRAQASSMRCIVADLRAALVGYDEPSHGSLDASRPREDHVRPEILHTWKTGAKG